MINLQQEGFWINHLYHFEQQIFSININLHFIAFVSPVQRMLPNPLGANEEVDIKWGMQKCSQ